MNVIWPSGLRISCKSARCGLPCSILDGFSQKTASIARLYSISSKPLRLKQFGISNGSGLWALDRPSHIPRQIIRTYASRRVITHFEDLPPSYVDEQGLQFRGKPLTEIEATAVFGKSVDVGSANRILSIVHGRRVAGTLEDPSLSGSGSGFDGQMKLLALQWLRRNVPVDEVECAGQRAVMELEADEAKILADSERLGIYKPNPDSVVQPNKGQNNVYGASGLDAIRREREQRLDEKEAAIAAQQKQAEEIQQTTGTLVPQDIRSRVELRRKGSNPRLQYYLDRAKVLPDVPPQLTHWQRLASSLMVSLLVIAVTSAIASVYVKPKNSARMWPDVPPAAATMITLITMNALVFLAWRVPPAFRILNKYFMSVPGYPRALAVIGNVFSHQSISHLAVNMTVLWFIGVRLHDDVGRANFLALYLSSGVISSMASLTVFSMRGIFISSSLGASGAIAGIVASYLWLHGPENFKFLGLPPDPWSGISAYMLLGLVVGSELIGMARGWRVGTSAKYDHYAHLGGYAAGILGATAVDRNMKAHARIMDERRKAKSEKSET